MSTTPTRNLAVVPGTLALSLSVAGCSSGSGGSTATSQPPRTVVVTSTESSTSTPSPSTSSGITPARDAGPGRCPASQLRGSLITPPGAASAGSVHRVLVLTDAGSTACTVSGFPGVSFVGDGNGTQLGSAARRDGGAGGPVTLQPTDSARADLTVAEAGDFPGCSPVTADGLRVYPPDDRDSLFVRTSGLTACRSSAVLLTVGPLR